MAKKIPPALMEPAIRLEVAGTPDAHQGLAEETKNFLATQNVDSFVISDSDTTRALIIKPEPLNADQPVNVLTSLSRGLLEKGCVVHFSTGHYLSDIGAFNAFGKHLIPLRLAVAMAHIEQRCLVREQGNLSFSVVVCVPCFEIRAVSPSHAMTTKQTISGTKYNH